MSCRITRIKDHLAGIVGNVMHCSEVSGQVRIFILKLWQKKRQRYAAKIREGNAEGIT